MLEVKSLSVKLKGKQILKDVNCSFDSGIHGLLGANGAGKTTLMRSMLGLYPQANGDAIYKELPLEKCRVGYLPQKFGLFPNMTVREALTYLGTTKGMSKSALKQDIEKCVKEVNLEDKIDSRISTLSGGMVRRVGIAQALMGNPDIVILDEPTAGLDPEERLRFKNMLKKQNEDKIIIVSTHIVDDVEYLCSHVTVMDAGKIIQQDSSENIRLAAKGKVFAITMEQAEKADTSFFVIKEFEKSQKKMLRVAMRATTGYEELEPTIEDGYICLVKGI